MHLLPEDSVGIQVVNMRFCCFFPEDIVHMFHLPMCNELRGNMARSTQFPIMITRSTIIYEIVSPGAAGSSIYI